MRAPNAARQLAREVVAHGLDVQYEMSEPDGLDIARQMTFTGHDLPELQKALILIVQHDPRIGAWETDDGTFAVIFVPTNQADYSHSFHLSEVLGILVEETPAPKDEPEPEKPPAKKAAAKKTTRKRTTTKKVADDDRV